MAVAAHSNQQTTTGTAKLLFGADAGRLWVTIKNNDGTNVAFISGDSGVVSGNTHQLSASERLIITGKAATVAMYVFDGGTNHVAVSYLEITEV